MIINNFSENELNFSFLIIAPGGDDRVKKSHWKNAFIPGDSSIFPKWQGWYGEK